MKKTMNKTVTMANLWLNVPGAKLIASERRFLKDSVEALQEERGADYKMLMVNIGVMWGASMHCLREGAPNATLCGVDIDFKKYKVYNRNVLNCMMIEGDSGEAHAYDLVKDFQIDVLFVDGSHKYKDVKKDIAGWVPKVLDGGLIIFHDYKPAPEDLTRDPSLVGVKKAVDEWYKGDNLGNFAMLTAPGSLKAFKRIVE